MLTIRSQFERMTSQISRHCLTTLGFAGLQGVFTTILGHGVKHLESLGLDQASIALVLIAAPICGAVFQPCFGILSDGADTPYGRRKPFIAVGTLLVSTSITALAWADYLATLIEPQENSAYAQNLMLIIGGSILVLFISLQAVQVGLRALINDECSPSEQVTSNAFASFYSNLAAMIGNLSAIFMRKNSTLNKGVDFRQLALLCVVCLTLTMTISCIVMPEQPLSRHTISSQRHFSVLSTVKQLLCQPSRLRTVYFVPFFGWLGWFPFLLYTETYIDGLSQKALASSSTAGIAAYHYNFGTLTLGVFSSVAFVVSCSLPSLVKKYRMLSLERIWIISFVLFAIAMLGTLVTQSPGGTMILFASVGFSWAVSSWVPFSLLAIEGGKWSRKGHLDRTVIHEEGLNTDSYWIDNQQDSMAERMGLLYGLQNIAICLPQVLVCLFTSIMMGPLSESTTGSVSSDNLSIVWVLRIGGFSALIGMYMVIRMPKEVAEDCQSADEAYLLKNEEFDD